MSRETDSSSSGPQGRGGAAYPSGTPPYGSRQYPSLHPSQDGPEGAPEPADPPQPEEPRTETTLTTRVRINIPGSRPIPPVVMRTPMSETDPTGGRPDPERTGATPAPGAAAQPSGGSAGARPEARDAGQSADGPAEKPAREKSGSDWFAPRKAPAPGAGTTPPAGTPRPGPQGSGPGQGPGPQGPGPGQGGPSGSGPTPPRPDSPFFSDAPRPGAPRPGAPRPGRSALDDLDGGGPVGPRPTPGAGGQGPSGPTTGPVTGSSPLTPDLDRLPGAGPQAGPGAPSGPRPPGGVPPRMSDDTAILTPQAPAPAPGTGGNVPGGNVSGDTLTSGIPVIPSESRSGFPGGPGGIRPEGPTGGGPADQGAPAPAPRPAPKPAPPARKGRSKLVLLGAGAVVLVGVAYGAGLLMNHSEVPKGTTVLGVDIGGGTKEEAVTKLEAAFGKRAQAPLKLSVDGKAEELDPAKAGLTLDSQETVRGAAGSDYNPVSVIGSLFGGARPADPVIPVDEEKLGLALNDLAGTAGTATDGTIKFEPNKAVAVPGRTGQSLDVDRSMVSVRDAYRAQVQTGKASVVELPVASREPTITKAELDRAMKEFAEPAMSGLVTIKAGPKQIDFGPARSLPQILSMKPVDGKLIPVYNTKAIDTLLDGVFDGVMITKGDGQKHEVSSTDVAQAMQGALLGKTPAERTAEIDLSGQG
ncbi:hypothetical protein [Streptomyces sp. NPDC059166]|uniref:hypothetical protein n=1 Tax=Streptomyces sp. NPDC059166 TaxID=3346752 RepID=UPI0036C537A6